MKNFLNLLLFLLIVLLISCSEDIDELGNENDLTILENELLNNGDVYKVESFDSYKNLFLSDATEYKDIHLVVLESVKDNFAGAKILGIEKYTAYLDLNRIHYSVFLDNRKEAVIFDNGQLLSIGTVEVNISTNELTLGQLPIKPLVRLYTSFSGYIVEEVRSIEMGMFQVDFKEGTTVRLDKNGRTSNRGTDDNGDDDEDEDGIEINPANLPTSIHDYVNINYPGESIVKAEQYPDQYEIELSNGLKLEFDLSGNFIEVSGSSGSPDDPNGEDGEDIDPSALPQEILDYIGINYPDVTIVGAEQDIQRYEVTLSNGLKLEFDLDGNFIEISGHSDDDTDDNDDDDEVIDPSRLPQPILDHINLNYPMETIVRAELDLNGYDVILSNGLKLEFDLDGNFIEISGGDNDNDNDDDGDMEDGEDIDPSSLPGIVITFLEDICPNETITEAEQTINGYEVTLSNGLKVEFDLEGNFVDFSGSDCNEISFSDLPQIIQDWLSQNFTSPVDKVKQCDFGFRIDLDDDTRIWLKSNGDVIYIGTDD